MGHSVRFKSPMNLICQSGAVIILSILTIRTFLVFAFCVQCIVFTAGGNCWLYGTTWNTDPAHKISTSTSTLQPTKLHPILSISSPSAKKKKLAWTCWTSSSSKQFQCLCVTLRQRDFSSFESHDPERSRPNPLHRWHFRTASLCISGQLTDWWCFNDIIKPMIYVNVQPKSHNWDKCLAVTCSATDTLPWSESSPLCVCS